MSKSNNQTSGISFFSLLFLLFLGLKLTGYISWSWWWVTAPLWAPLTTLIVVLVITFVLMFVFECFKGRNT